MAKIHIADDEPDIRQFLTLILTEEGHQVSVSTEGRQSLEMMLHDVPDVLVLDLMMPEMDGYDVLRELQDHEILGRTKVLVLTAKSTEEDRRLGFELGADTYLAKPCDPDEIVAAIHELLELPKEALKVRREKERDKAHLLSQLESILEE